MRYFIEQREIEGKTRFVVIVERYSPFIDGPMREIVERESVEHVATYHEAIRIRNFLAFYDELFCSAT